MRNESLRYYRQPGRVECGPYPSTITLQFSLGLSSFVHFLVGKSARRSRKGQRKGEQELEATKSEAFVGGPCLRRYHRRRPFSLEKAGCRSTKAAFGIVVRTTAYSVLFVRRLTTHFIVFALFTPLICSTSGSFQFRDFADKFLQTSRNICPFKYVRRIAIP